MPRHHEVFSHFKPFSGEAPAAYHVDFLGTKIRHEYIAGLVSGCPEAQVIRDLYPCFDEEYFEWIDLLESVIAARGSYTMLELGAGYGPWAVRAAYAARQYNPNLRYRLIAVEAEPVHFGWMPRHFTENGIDVSKHLLLQSAVSDEDGKVMFYIGGPEGSPYDCDPNSWYGQFLTKNYDVSGESTEDGEYCGFTVLLHKSGWRSISVPGITLASLIRDLERVDLIDMDIQGQELAAVQSAIEALNVKVRRLHIGTHGKEIEFGLRQTLAANRWSCCADYSGHSTSETPWGTISFEDGVQSWVNTRF